MLPQRDDTNVLSVTQSLPAAGAVDVAMERGGMLLMALPSLPHALLAGIDACRSEVDFDRVCEAIALDPVLYARVLDVHSGQTQSAKRLLPLGRMLVHLGADAVRTLLISCAMGQSVIARHGPGEFDFASHWLHAVRCAGLARLLARKCAYQFSEEAYVAGLLHGVGRLTFATRAPRAFARVAEARAGSRESGDAERSVFGVSAGEVGERLARGWNLQSFLADALLYHGEPPQRLAGAHPLVRTIHLAYVATAARAAVPYELASSLLGIDAAEFDEIRAQADEQLGQTLQALGLPPAVDQPGVIGTAVGEGIKRLARTVGDLGFVSRLRPNLSGFGSVPEILAAMRKAIHILFGFPQPLFFLYDATRAELVGVPLSEQNPLLAQLSVPYGGGDSLLVLALQQRAPACSLNAGSGGHSVIDEQIVRFAQHEGILCLPLVGRREVMGVIVLGVDPGDVRRLEAQEKLLATFAEQAGLALEVAQSRLRRERMAEPDSALIPRATLRQFAHEINNPLAIVKNYVRILRLKLGSEDPAQFGLEVINDEIDRAARMVRTLADVPTAPTPAVELVDINRVILDLIGITNEPLLRGQDVRLQTALDHSAQPLRCDRNRLKQVLINLIRNAAEAVGPSGTVSVETHASVLRNGKDGIEIGVSDDGPGIPKAVLARLFQPVVSTKGDGHAGLGLAIVQALISEMGASIDCDTGEGLGTRFRIHIPKT